LQLVAGKYLKTVFGVVFASSTPATISTSINRYIFPGQGRGTRSDLFHYLPQSKAVLDEGRLVVIK